jgi:hypothetical protein
MDPLADRSTPAQALAIYAEALVPRSVIAVLGDSSDGVGELLSGLGARAVHVWDPDAARALANAEGAPRGVTVRALVREDFVRRDFDLVIVADLGLFADPAVLLADARRMVGEEGVVIVAAPNRESASAPQAGSFEYYELFDIVAREFDFVRMVAQLPFEGVTLVELGDDPDATEGVSAVSVDTQLGEQGSPPEVFVALGSQRDVRLDPYALVQLPPSARRAAALEVDIDAGAAAEAASAVSAAAVAVAVATTAALEAQLRERSEAAAVLEAALSERARQGAALSGQLEDFKASAHAARLAAAEELDELIARVDRAERRAAELQGEVTHLEGEGRSTEHGALEEMLRERAQVIRELEGELGRRDRLVRELAGALEDASAAPQPSAAPRPADTGESARLREQLDALALDLARREGEAQAARWSIQELERRVEIADRGATQSSSESDMAARLAAALDELDALRRALVQEHEAKARAEARAGLGGGATAGESVGAAGPGPTDTVARAEER